MAEIESANKKAEDEKKQDSAVKDVIDSNVNTDGRKPPTGSALCITASWWN